MTPLEVLIKARKRLEKGWCQYVMALDANGLPITPFGKRAKAYCTIGAIAAETGTNVRLRVKALELLDLYESPAQWNDRPRRTYQQVLNKFDAAIKRAKKGQR